MPRRHNTVSGRGASACTRPPPPVVDGVDDGRVGVRISRAIIQSCTECGTPVADPDFPSGDEHGRLYKVWGTDRCGLLCTAMQHATHTVRPCQIPSNACMIDSHHVSAR